MGCFSWDCIVCRRSLRGAKASRRRPGEAWASDVVLVPERGEPMAGEYDGYGRVAGVPMPESWGTMESDELRFDIERSRQQLARFDAVAGPAPAEGEGEGEADSRVDSLRKILADIRANTLAAIERCTASLREAEAAEVRFSAYHQRCWEQAGRPGFGGQSPRSRDQGLW